MIDVLLWKHKDCPYFCWRMVNVNRGTKQANRGVGKTTWSARIRRCECPRQLGRTGNFRYFSVFLPATKPENLTPFAASAKKNRGLRSNSTDFPMAACLG